MHTAACVKEEVPTPKSHKPAGGKMKWVSDIVVERFVVKCLCLIVMYFALWVFLSQCCCRHKENFQKDY